MIYPIELINIEQLKRSIKRLTLIIENIGPIRKFGNNGFHWFEPTQGLCYNVDLPQIVRSFDVKPFMEVLFGSWVHYSGNWKYPVGGIEEYGSRLNLYENSRRFLLAYHVRNRLEELLGNIEKHSKSFK